MDSKDKAGARKLCLHKRHAMLKIWTPLRSLPVSLETTLLQMEVEATFHPGNNRVDAKLNMFWLSKQARDTSRAIGPSAWRE